MISEICHYLRNYFDRGMPKYQGKFWVSGGYIESLDGTELDIKDQQYYYIVGSTFNDGVWKYNCCCNFEDTENEEFDGEVCLMAIPPSFLALVKEIEDWQEKYGGVDSASMSPYQSESFGGYSYTKAGTGGTSGTSGTWQAAFASRLAQWRKI